MEKHYALGYYNPISGHVLTSPVNTAVQNWQQSVNVLSVDEW